MARANLLKADPGREPFHNPAHPMCCFFCGREIGLINRLRGDWYCSVACQQEDVSHKGADKSLRDLLAVGLGTGLALVAVKLFNPKMDWVENVLPADYLGRFAGGSWASQAGDLDLKFVAELTKGLERSAAGVWRARQSFLFEGIGDTREMRLESTGRGGVGYLFGAGDEMKDFLGLQIRPRGGDFVLRTALRSGQSVAGRVREVPLRTGVSGQAEQSFILDKVRDRFSLFVRRRENDWRWLHTWTEPRLDEGRAGLFVERGHDFWLRNLRHGRPPAG